MPTIIPPIDLCSYILILGFCFGIIAYNIALYLNNYESIYLYLSTSLFTYVLGVGQWHSAMQRLFYDFYDIPTHEISLILDTANVILFALFLLKFLKLFADFDTKHPILTALLKIYIIVGFLLILCYIPLPDIPLAYNIKNAFVSASCLTVIGTLPIYYRSLQHLRLVTFSTNIFCLITAIFFINQLLPENRLHSGIINFLLYYALLFFTWLSLLITKHLNQDRELKAQKIAYFIQRNPLLALTTRAEFDLHLQESLSRPNQQALLFIDVTQAIHVANSHAGTSNKEQQTGTRFNPKNIIENGDELKFLLHFQKAKSLKKTLSPISHYQFCGMLVYSLQRPVLDLLISSHTNNL